MLVCLYFVIVMFSFYCADAISFNVQLADAFVCPFELNVEVYVEHQI